MKIEISSVYDLPQLAACWTELESRAAGNFFLSWRWIGTWLRTTGARPLLVKASEDDTVLALGLLTPLKRKRHFLSIGQLCLHETGIPQFDALMIEYNNFLMARGAPADLAVEILRAVQSGEPSWDEIVLEVFRPRSYPPCKTLGCISRWTASHRISVSNCPHLLRLVAGKTRFPPISVRSCASPGLSRNASGRSSYRRPRTRVRPWNFSTRWCRCTPPIGKGGANLGHLRANFRNASIVTLFLTNPVRRRWSCWNWPPGIKILGYLYNFQYGGRTYNYQSGFSYIDDNRHRPGLIAHAMAIEQARGRGMQVYDFLAGDAQYKARLGHPMGSMVWCRLQRDRPLLRVERSMRRLYQSLRGARDRSG